MSDQGVPRQRLVRGERKSAITYAQFVEDPLHSPSHSAWDAPKAAEWASSRL